MKSKKNTKIFYNILFVIAILIYAWQTFHADKEKSTRPVLHSEKIIGTVYNVVDGDTVELKVPNQSQLVRIRVYGIDAPELKQSYGLEAKKALSNLLTKNAEVEVVEQEIDIYNRVVGRIFIDGTEVSPTMLATGNAWVYTHYCDISECNQWKSLSKTARQAKKGLWQEKNPTPPWTWRKQNKK